MITIEHRFVDILPVLREKLGQDGTTLGQQRLLVTQLVRNFLKLESKVVEIGLQSSGIIEMITDLFFSYPWHSVLHGLFADIVHVILDCRSIDLKRSLMLAGQLPHRILTAVKNPATLKNRKTMRSGHLGHITKISNQIVNYESIHFDLKSMLMKCEGWQ